MQVHGVLSKGSIKVSKVSTHLLFHLTLILSLNPIDFDIKWLTEFKSWDAFLCRFLP